MAIEIGMALPPLYLKWAANAEQAFSAGFRDSSDNPLVWSGTDHIRLVIGNPASPSATFNATLTAGGFANWSISAAQSLAAYIGQTVRLEYLSGTTVYLWSQGTVIAS